MADWDVEIGCFCHPKTNGDLTSVFLFDDIKGYPSGYRVAVPRLNTAKQVALTLNIPELPKLELIGELRKRLPRWESCLDKFPPRVVKSGSILENVHSGDDVNLLMLPTPKWHELDGGRYIGTADAVITKDPDTGEVNLGTYRVMVHDEKTLGIFIAPSKHGRNHMEKYHARGQACPVALSVGHHPLIFAMASSGFVGCEYNWVGAIREEPLEVVTEEVTGIPIPADSEIVLAGWIPPDKTRVEGPFGEWTGHYGRMPSPMPVIEVERIYHRNNPIMTGYPPMPPMGPQGAGSARAAEAVHFKAVICGALMKNELAAYGVPDVKRVWYSNEGLSSLIVASIKQRYAGHAKRVGLLISQSHQLDQARYVIVVDEDIDPSNISDVLWALCFRSDPEKDIQIIPRCRTEPLYPMWEAGTPIVCSISVIDACIPFERLNNFPKVIGVDPGYAEKFRKKWKDSIL